MAEKTARAPEKSSNFSIACGLLSQYIKQKRSLGDLMASRSYEAKGATQPPTTMSLFPGLNVPAGEDNDSETRKRAEDSEQNITKPTDLFPQLVNIDLTAPVLRDTTKEANERDKEKAQLTIFYDGKVLVFDNFPADKAKELIDMANKKCSSMQDFSFATPSSSMAAVAVAAAAAAADQPPKSPLRCSDVLASTSGEQKDGNQGDPPKPAQTTASIMPVARRASLHRFLEKRKDRINAKAPYELNGSSPPAKPEGSPSWLGLGPKSSKPGSSKDGRE